MRLLSILLLAHLIAVSALAANQRPNIVFILADDPGYGGVGCHGTTKVKTPNIHRLASEGRRFGARGLGLGDRQFRP